MACILKPECNFRHGNFRCLLSEETMDIEVKIKTMRGTHTLRRDCTAQVISCNPWSTRLHTYPSLIRKMKTYLELEGKLGALPQPQPHTSISSPDKNLLPQKTLVLKKAEKNRAKVPVKRRFNVRVIAQPMPTNPNLSVNPVLPTDPTPTAVTTTVKTQMPVAKQVTATATLIPVTVYNLAQGKFRGIPYPTRKPQEERIPLHPAVTIPLWSSNPKLQALPQPHRTGRTANGLIPCKLP